MVSEVGQCCHIAILAKYSVGSAGSSRLYKSGLRGNGLSQDAGALSIAAISITRHKSAADRIAFTSCCPANSNRMQLLARRTRPRNRR